MLKQNKCSTYQLQAFEVAEPLVNNSEKAAGDTVRIQDFINVVQKQSHTSKICTELFARANSSS